MNPIMTNAEFHEAWCSLSWSASRAPDGYWEEIHKQRKKHRFVGKKAFYRGKIVECYEAEDDLVLFRFLDDRLSELIVSGDKVADIKWLKEE